MNKDEKNKELQLEAFKEVLDLESWEWLLEYHPLIAKRLDSAIQAGATQHEIRTIAWEHTRRQEFVVRIDNATRHLRSQYEED